MENKIRGLRSVLVGQEEAEAIAELEQLLSLETLSAKVVSNGEIKITESALTLLRQVVRSVASGEPVSLMPHNYQLTTQEAADLLNVSEGYLIKLLDRGEIAEVLAGSERRVLFQQAIAYKEARDKKRRQHLKQLTQMSQEAGFYQTEEPLH